MLKCVFCLFSKHFVRKKVTCNARLTEMSALSPMNLRQTFDITKNRKQTLWAGGGIICPSVLFISYSFSSTILRMIDSNCIRSIWIHNRILY